MPTPDRSSGVSDPIDQLSSALRQPGTADELADEALAVDAIASAMTTTNGSTMPLQIAQRAGRKARVASFIAAGIIGFGGVAAAGPAVVDLVDDNENDAVETNDAPAPDMPDLDGAVVVVSDVPSTDVPNTEVPTTEVSEEPDAPVTTSEPEAPTTDVTTTTEVAQDDDESDDDAGETVVDNPDTAFDETECAEGNHGKTVSSVARSEGRSAEDVRDAAQSDCGKKDKTDDDSDDDADEDDAEDDADEDDADEDGDDDGDEDDGDEDADREDTADRGNGRNNGGQRANDRTDDSNDSESNRGPGNGNSGGNTSGNSEDNGNSKGGGKNGKGGK